MVDRTEIERSLCSLIQICHGALLIIAEGVVVRQDLKLVAQVSRKHMLVSRRDACIQLP